MKLFLSWSKSASHDFALVLREWIPQVIQEVEPWLSSEIDKGQRWSAALNAQLDEINQGILCVTPENRAEPWLNFEAGALAKQLDESRVRPILLGLKPSELTGPLSQFQATVGTDKADMLKLMRSINSKCARPLDQIILEKTFERVWDEMKEKLISIKTDPQASPPTRSSEDMIAEILEVVRELQRANIKEHDDRPALTRIANHLRQSQQNAVFAERPDRFDVHAVLNSQVNHPAHLFPGIIKMLRTTLSGKHTVTVDFVGEHVQMPLEEILEYNPGLLALAEGVIPRHRYSTEDAEVAGDDRKESSSN